MLLCEQCWNYMLFGLNWKNPMVNSRKYEFWWLFLVIVYIFWLELISILKLLLVGVMMVIFLGLIFIRMMYLFPFLSPVVPFKASFPFSSANFVLENIEILKIRTIIIIIIEKGFLLDSTIDFDHRCVSFTTTVILMNTTFEQCWNYMLFGLS